MRYSIYNKLYKSGRAISKPYLAGTSKKGETLTSFKKQIIKYNRSWNNLKSSKKAKIKAKIVKIKQIG